MSLIVYLSGVSSDAAMNSISRCISADSQVFREPLARSLPRFDVATTRADLRTESRKSPVRTTASFSPEKSKSDWAMPVAWCIESTSSHRRVLINCPSPTEARVTYKNPPTVG